MTPEEKAQQADAELRRFFGVGAGGQAAPAAPPAPAAAGAALPGSDPSGRYLGPAGAPTITQPSLSSASIGVADPNTPVVIQYIGPDGKRLDESAGPGKKPFDQQSHGGWPVLGAIGVGKSTGIVPGTARETTYANGRRTREVYKDGNWGEPQVLPTNGTIAQEYQGAINKAAGEKSLAASREANADRANAGWAELLPAQARQATATAAGQEQENAFRAANGGRSPAELTAQWNSVQQFARDEVAKDNNRLDWAKAYLAQEHQNFVNGMQSANLSLEKAKVQSSERQTDMSMATDIARQTGENARAMLPYMQTPEQGKYRSELMDYMMNVGTPNARPAPTAPANQGAPVFDPQKLAHDAAMVVLRGKYGQGGQSGSAFTLPPSTDLSSIKAPTLPFGNAPGPIANPGQVAGAFTTPPMPGGPTGPGAAPAGPQIGSPEWVYEQQRQRGLTPLMPGAGGMPVPVLAGGATT